MYAIPELIPISDLRQRQREIIELLSEGPVVLTQHGRAAAVLVHPRQWNQLLEEYEDLHDALDAVEARDEPTVDLEEYLAKRGDVVPAPAGP